MTPLKRLLLALAVTGAVSACGRADTLQTGDLLFVGYPEGVVTDSISGAIAASTGNGGLDFVHTAIVDMAGDSVYVIDATIRYGVHRHPLDTLVKQFTLQDGTAPVLVYMRLKDNSRAAEYVNNARRFIGEEYDKYFLPDNGRHYCTELVYDSYVDGGERIFSAAPMNWTAPDGSIPQYWVDLFEYLGQPVPQGVPGTNPQAMSEDESLIKLTLLQ